MTKYKKSDVKKFVQKKDNVYKGFGLYFPSRTQAERYVWKRLKKNL